jgi:phage terminase large subunit-like protein
MLLVGCSGAGRWTAGASWVEQSTIAASASDRPLLVLSVLGDLEHHL